MKKKEDPPFSAGGKRHSRRFVLHLRKRKKKPGPGCKRKRKLRERKKPFHYRPERKEGSGNHGAALPGREEKKGENYAEKKAVTFLFVPVVG